MYARPFYSLFGPLREGSFVRSRNIFHSGETSAESVEARPIFCELLCYLPQLGLLVRGSPQIKTAALLFDESHQVCTVLRWVDTRIMLLPPIAFQALN